MPLQSANMTNTAAAVYHQRQMQQQIDAGDRQRATPRRASSFRKPTDCSASSDARTSCASSDSDCALWDRLSSGSSTSEQDSDGWSSRSHSPERRRSPSHTKNTPIAASLSANKSPRRHSGKSAVPPTSACGEKNESERSLQQRHRGRTTSPAKPKSKETTTCTSATSQQSPSTFAVSRVRPIVRPVNTGPPTEYDFRNTNGLLKCLNAIAQLPTPDELSAKHLVINEVQRLVDDWLRTTFGPEQETTATLLLGGSWHLKVGLFDSDLDIVTLLPSFVTPELFFGSLFEYLRDAVACVSKIVAMKKAAMPILAFQLNGIRIDLLFARYTQPVVPKNLPIHSDQVLVGMDTTSIRSLSVPRVASLILELVPNGCTFRSCLRVVRLWAKRRGVYSSKAGFLGGISWTILVAFVCQMFPKATISSVVHRFFTILSSWSWPTPVLISKPYESPELESCVQWSPQRNLHDRGHVMPIITPGFPAVNSSVNVNASTLRILQEEFERGKQILDDMELKGLSSPAVWQKLFAPTEFLVRYDHYLVLELCADDEEELSEWASFVASRTRKLVETLEHTSPIVRVHPLPELIKSEEPPTITSSARGYFLVGYTVSSDGGGGDGGGAYQSVVSVKPRDAKEELAAAESCVLPAARYFLGTELGGSCPERRQSMRAEITYKRWQELPDALFAHGRKAAAGERARFILSKAHSLNVSLGLGRS